MKTRSSCILVAIASCLAGCTSSTDGSGEPDGGRPDSGEPDAGEPDGAAQDSGTSCVEGDEASVTVGAAGGGVSLCGASVDIDPGVLAEPRELTLRVAATPTDAPYPLEPAGPAFAVELEGGVPAVMPPALEIIVPHEETTHYVYFFRHTEADGWQEIEACTANAQQIGQRVAVEGTFVALMDTVEFPGSVEGLGGGTVATTFQGDTKMFDLDTETFETYAIFDEGQSGDRVFDVSAAHLLEGSQVELVRIHVGVDAQGKAGVIDATYGTTADVDGFWTYLPFDEGEATVEITDASGGALSGTATVPMMRGEVTETLTIAIDVTAELYRFPPELSCEQPEG